MSEGKSTYFKCNLNEKANYAHNFHEKHFLFWCDKNEINDEIIRRKKTDIYWKFKFLFLSFFSIGRKFNTKNVNFYLPTKKLFL